MNHSRPSWVRWQIVGLMVAFSFMTWFNRISISIAYNDAIKRELGISEPAIGSVYSIFFVAYMLFMTPGGWFVDRFGPKLALVLMGFGSALFGALTGLAGVVALSLVLPVFFVVRFLMGVFSAPVYPAGGRLVSYWVPRGQRTFANGLIQSGAAVGMACTAPVFGFLIHQFGWPTAFVVSGTVTALLALVWTVFATDHPAQHAAVNEAERDHIGAEPHRPLIREPAVSWPQLFRNRSLVLLTVTYAAVGYIEYLFFFWMDYYFKEVLKLSESRLYSATLYVGFAVGMVLGGWVADRYGQRRGRVLVPMLGMTFGALFLWLGLKQAGEEQIVACLAVALGCVGACEATVWTTAIELGGRQGGTAAAICNTGGNLGGLIAPALTPVIKVTVMSQFGLSEEASWQWAISVGSAICLLGASLWIWIDPNKRPGDR
jgi:ACS family D-galactonate transporter-like MFS transporter